MSVLPPIGTLYHKNYNGIAWSQPGGPNTTVFPQQNDGQFAGYPILGNIISEAGESLWHSPCGHGWDCMLVERDFDDSTHKSVAVYQCPICSLILQYVEPFEDIYSFNMPYLIP